MMTNRLTKCSLLLSVSFCLLLASFSCNSPNESTNNLTLSVDVSCTEAWLNIKTSNVSLPQKLEITRNGETEFNITISANDTTIYDDGLSPNKNYTYQAVLSNNQNPVSSNRVSVITLDTTSHNFTWQTFTFGDAGAGSSVLNDVAIIDENNIWAVGEINIADTSENGYTTYNAVHWNGNEWVLKKITVDFRGFKITPPLEGVFAFSKNDVWFVGSLPIHGDGENWIMYDLRTTIDPNISLSKAWGSGSDNMYFVGLDGNVAHYQKGLWSRIESGTDLNFYDIWGDNNATEGYYEINCVAAEHLISHRRELFKINNNSVQEVSSVNIPDGSLYGIWFESYRKYYVVGNGIYTKNNINNSDPWTSLHNNLTPYYTYSVRGSSLNNIFICGSFGEVLHFNGFSFKSYRDMQNFKEVEFLKTNVKESIIVAVGHKNNNAFLTIGKK